MPSYSASSNLGLLLGLSISLFCAGQPGQLTPHACGQAFRLESFPSGPTVSLSGGEAACPFSAGHQAQEKVKRKTSQKSYLHYVAESFYAQGRRVMFAWGDDGSGRPHVELYSTATGKRLAELVGPTLVHQEPQNEFHLRDAVIAPDGSRVFLWGENVTGSYALDVPSGQLAWVYSDDIPLAAEITADSKYLLLGQRHKASLLSMRTGELIKVLLSFPLGENPQDRNYVDSVAFSTNGKYAATTTTTSASEDVVILIWAIPVGRQVQRFHSVNVQEVLFSPDGRHLLTLSSGPTKEECNIVGIWDWRTGRLVHTFSLPIEHMPRKVVFTPDGKQLLANGKFISIWEVATGREVRRFPTGRSRSGFYAFCLSPDGRYILSGNQLWRLSPDKLVRELDAP